jgi:hypothetical protein
MEVAHTTRCLHVPDTNDMNITQCTVGAQPAIHAAQALGTYLVRLTPWLVQQSPRHDGVVILVQPTAEPVAAQNNLSHILLREQRTA